MVGKKGYFFVVDAIIAATILMFGLFYLFGTAISVPEQTQSFTTVEDFSKLLLYTSLSDSTNTYYTSTLLPQGLVPYPDNTPLEEISYLVFSNATCATCMASATDFSKSMMDEALDARYGASISVNGTLVYARPVSQHTLLYSRQIIIYTRMNSTTLIGPVIGEVQLWY